MLIVFARLAPQHFMQGDINGYIRYLPGHQNGGVANRKESGWSRFCKYPPKRSVALAQGGDVEPGIVEQVITTTVTLNVMSYTWKNVPFDANDPYKLTANPCRPSALTADVGYALFTTDPWYGRNRIDGDYNSSPGQKTVGVDVPVLRRDTEIWDPVGYVDGNIIVDNGNSSRHASHDELEQLGYERCASRDCKEELELLAEQIAELDLSLSALPSVSALATAATPQAVSVTAPSEPCSKPLIHASEPTTAPMAARHSNHLRHHRHRHGHEHGHP